MRVSIYSAVKNGKFIGLNYEMTYKIKDQMNLKSI